MHRRFTKLTFGLALFGIAAMTQAVPITTTTNIPAEAFTYMYNSQNPSNTGTADPNAVTVNATYDGDGGAPFSKYYDVPQGTTPGTVTYTFTAAPGDTFSGQLNLLQNLGIFNGTGAGSITGTLTATNGLNTTLFTASGNGGPVSETESGNPNLNVTGATAFTLTYTISNPAGDANGKISDQLFRQSPAGTGPGNTDTPFIVSGTVVPEPASLACVALSSLGLLVRRRRNV